MTLMRDYTVGAFRCADPNCTGKHGTSGPVAKICPVALAKKRESDRRRKQQRYWTDPVYRSKKSDYGYTYRCSAAGILAQVRYRTGQGLQRLELLRQELSTMAAAFTTAADRSDSEKNSASIGGAE
jgi:hypothetical protein